MAEDQNSTLSLQLEKCFEDLDALLVVCELERNTISKNVIEVIINNLETCVEFLLQIIPTLHDTRNDVTEIAINLQVIYRDWCRKLSELQLRYRPNCTHLGTVHYLWDWGDLKFFRKKNGGPPILSNINGEGPEKISFFIKLVNFLEKENCLWVTLTRNALLCNKFFFIQ